MSDLSCPKCGSSQSEGNVDWTTTIDCSICDYTGEKWRWNGDPQSGRTFEWNIDVHTTIDDVDRDELQLLERRLFRLVGRSYSVEVTAWTDGSWSAQLFHTAQSHRYTVVRFSDGQIREALTRGTTVAELEPIGGNVVWENVLYDPTNGQP